MITKILTCVAMLGTSLVSNATLLKWEFSGTFDTASNTGGFNTGTDFVALFQLVALVDGNAGIGRVTGFRDVSQVPSPATIGLFEIPKFLFGYRKLRNSVTRSA